MTILDEAAAIVYGDREQTYDDPNANFRRIAARWETVLDCKVSIQQVALCMIDVKMARLTHSPNHHDSLVDIAGYAACYERTQTPEREWEPFEGTLSEALQEPRDEGVPDPSQQPLDAEPRLDRPQQLQAGLVCWHQIPLAEPCHICHNACGDDIYKRLIVAKVEPR